MLNAHFRTTLLRHSFRKSYGLYKFLRLALRLPGHVRLQKLPLTPPQALTSKSQKTKKARSEESEEVIKVYMLLGKQPIRY